MQHFCPLPDGSDNVARLYLSPRAVSCSNIEPTHVPYHAAILNPTPRTWHSATLNSNPLAVSYSNRSASLLKLSKVAKAAADAEECIARRPDWDKAHVRRGAVLEAKGMLPEVRHRSSVFRLRLPCHRTWLSAGPSLSSRHYLVILSLHRLSRAGSFRAGAKPASIHTLKPSKP